MPENSSACPKTAIGVRQRLVQEPIEANVTIHDLSSLYMQVQSEICRIVSEVDPRLIG